MGDLWTVGKIFLSGFWRHSAYLLPAVFILPFEIYEFIVRPNAGGDLPEHLNLPAFAFPWVLGATALWTAFLTYRDLYREKKELEDSLPKSDDKFLDELREFYNNHSTSEGDRLLQPYLDRTVQIRGKVNDVHIGDWGAFVSIQRPFPLSLHLNFNKEHSGDARTLRSGDSVVIKGKIRRVYKFGAELGDCELVLP